MTARANPNVHTSPAQPEFKFFFVASSEETWYIVEVLFLSQRLFDNQFNKYPNSHAALFISKEEKDVF
ncbi:hypothetical protein MNBD_PLANCTO02-897 [hydrothermal vent metagenome]|uniref:Uncharacterized protein n=1 Tax=hydrothermal vent metagenome TaxID=652676 RepID=A0A3B1DMT2_9ZZZZ